MITEKRFLIEVSEREFQRVMEERREWQRMVRSGEFARRFGVSVAEHTIRELERASVNKGAVGLAVVREMGSASWREETALAVMRGLRQRLGRNFEWRGERRSWLMVEGFIAAHEREREAVMEVVSGIRLVEKIGVWSWWQEEHGEEVL